MRLRSVSARWRASLPSLRVFRVGVRASVRVPDTRSCVRDALLIYSRTRYSAAVTAATAMRREEFPSVARRTRRAKHARCYGDERYVIAREYRASIPFNSPGWRRQDRVPVRENPRKNQAFCHCPLPGNYRARATQLISLLVHSAFSFRRFFGNLRVCTLCFTHVSRSPSICRDTFRIDM